MTDPKDLGIDIDEDESVNLSTMNEDRTNSVDFNMNDLKNMNYSTTGGASPLNGKNVSRNAMSVNLDAINKR